MTRRIIAALVAAGALAAACGQPGDVRVVRKDGSIVEGRLAASTSVSVTLETAAGVVEIASADIVRIERGTTEAAPPSSETRDAEAGGDEHGRSAADEGRDARRGGAPTDDRAADSGGGRSEAGERAGGSGRSSAGGGERRFRLEMPAGTKLSLETNTAVGSNSDEVGTVVRAKLVEDVKLGALRVFAGGSTVMGVVSAAQKSTLGGRARIAVRFTSVETDAGPVEISTSEVARETEPDKKSGFLGKVLKGAQRGVGAVTRIGGKEARIEAGSRVSVTLRRPVAVDPASGR